MSIHTYVNICICNYKLCNKFVLINGILDSIILDFDSLLSLSTLLLVSLQIKQLLIVALSSTVKGLVRENDGQSSRSFILILREIGRQ